MENVTTFFENLGDFMINMSMEAVIITTIIFAIVCVTVGLIVANAYVKYWRKNAPKFYGELLDDVLHEKEKAKERRNK